MKKVRPFYRVVYDRTESLNEGGCAMTKESE